MSGFPPVIDNEAFQSQNDLAGIGVPRTGLGAEAAVQATPELRRTLQDPFLGAQLDVADHPAGKVLVHQRADGGAGAAIEAIQRRVNAETGELLGKFRMN